MKVTQHGKNLWQITRLTAFNSFLVREDDGLTVVDTNMSGSGKDILQAAASIGLPIRRITLTHAHADHAGSLDEVAAQAPEAEVAITGRMAEFLRGNLALLPDEPQVKLRGSFVTRDTQATQLIGPDDKLGSLRVISAPGHTPDHIAFYDERDDTLIAGDAFQTKGGIAVAGITRWLFPFPGMAAWHLPTALETAVALRAFNPARMAVGHGRVLENPAAEMDKAIQEAGARVDAQAQVA
ncbi:MAG TPA: MBL fold metallo-hydrolase [Anaerolineae bacterium]|jgi:glyoxylase-like metal-dependent hydrolase (beta-lactamase superfamily II)|nr:MBL fold metallo-hydrolase [Anaerolineae bacterium]